MSRHVYAVLHGLGMGVVVLIVLMLLGLPLWIGPLWFLLLMLRVLFVGATRARILEQDLSRALRSLREPDEPCLSRYDSLPSFERMVWQLWKWRY